MDEILKTEGGLRDDLITGAEAILANCFIDTADEATIRALEKWLGISLYSSRTLEERRRVVRAFFTGFGKVSATAIEETIRAYTGANVECRFEVFDENGNNKLFINFERGEEAALYYSDITFLLSRMIPAHIDFTATVTYRFPVAVTQRRTFYKYGYDLSGTKPETVLIAAIHTVEAATEENATKVLMNYRQARASGTDSEAGHCPQTTTLAHHDVIDAATEASPFNSSVDYIPCGTIAAHS